MKGGRSAPYSDSSTPSASGENATANRLKALLLEAGKPLLSSQQLDYFSAYLSLIIRWNARMNLTSIRTEDGILARHFVESIACARAIPDGVRTLLDYGSGAGFPGIPIAICRPEITVTLAESQGKKAAFLQEVVRSLQLSASVHHGRADAVRAEFDCVTLRAVDKIDEAVASAGCLVARDGVLALMTTEAAFPRLRQAAGMQFTWNETIRKPDGEDLILALGKRGNFPA